VLREAAVKDLTFLRSDLRAKRLKIKHSIAVAVAVNKYQIENREILSYSFAIFSYIIVIEFPRWTNLSTKEKKIFDCNN